jgi:c-di-GMP-binding flagellar brake protein YcgR
MLARALSSWGRLLGLGRSGPASEEERRLWGRVPCDVETTCQLASDHSGQRLAARVRDLSRGGVSLTVPRSFELGTLLSVSLPASGAGVEVLACVVRCAHHGPENWELGCTFAAELSDEDLRAFGARRERAAEIDQRDWVRYDCHAQAAYQAIRSEDPEARHQATVLNISAGGIALQVEEALHVGDLLSLELSRDGTFVLTTLASVVRTGTGPGGVRLVGCNFIRELAEEQILTLL